jgi:hypothetical protein
VYVTPLTPHTGSARKQFMVHLVDLVAVWDSLGDAPVSVGRTLGVRRRTEKIVMDTSMRK